VVIVLSDRTSKDNPRVVIIDKSMFRCSPGFIIGSVIICGILAALYTVFW